ncbi:excinuclease ABC, B subunit [Desulfurispirillum indicum S5]|uniref:UvrABC system protein B n=1 Tax=Desulfurispirillum indicum (strain ATCC BAA-1389 / DSM 22839 / S5) TaxID=653733 RepID=E6W5Y1_DESIS|nr:excinuclease ABC subunit UvrB [Desulfurispirillum indicum]ADU67266.1 excinuclease ABC, B subunit [Desulfurispirillum indicum S5]
MQFRVVSPYSPAGSQPQAIEKITRHITEGTKHQVLLGVTGSGKTYTMAKIVEAVQKPTLVIAHNKTLAAQLYQEFKEFFPDNAVEYFVSYYDYYQPEAYIPTTDTFIEKDSSINDKIDRLRHSATRSILERRDVLIVASVSCIYGLGSAEFYLDMVIPVDVDSEVDMEELAGELVRVQYTRNDTDFRRGTFRRRGDIIEIFPSYEIDSAIRIEFFGDTVEAIWEIDPLTGEKRRSIEKLRIYPNSHYVADKSIIERAIGSIKADLKKRLDYFRSENKLLEAQRIEQRTNFDIEMLEEFGFCQGIENYSRYVDGRSEGEPPHTLLSYMPDDALIFIDESHVTIPQVRGMYNGDRSRKMTLVDYGFRLPAALDNRPLNFEEFNSILPQAVYVSATPAEYEKELSGHTITELIIRPTGLLDPEIEVRPSTGQVDNLVFELKKVIAEGGKALVTTLTIRLSENLSDYLIQLGIKVKYLHSKIDTIERSEIIRDLRLGVYDVVVGINLLREGLDIPEVQLVAILDADKEGFLRSERSLMQTAGRAARNLKGRVIMYGDKVTQSMQSVIDTTAKRRAIQQAYNEEHGITPQGISKAIGKDLIPELAEERQERLQGKVDIGQLADYQIREKIVELQAKMQRHAEELDFESAASVRDEIFRLQKHLGE